MNPEDQVPYTQAVHDAIAPIKHLEDDAMLCAGFAIQIEHRIERELASLPPEVRANHFVVFCKVCCETYRWCAVLSPWYERAHRYRSHPNTMATFETLGSVRVEDGPERCDEP